MSGGEPIQVVVITEPIGVGKTTTIEALGSMLADQEMPHTLIDMDWLRMSSPRPAGDPFNVELGYRNLRDVARNSLATGIARFVLADVVETREQRARYRQAVPGSEVTIVRLTTDLSRIEERIERRAGADPDAWEPKRVVELFEIMDVNDVADVLIDTTDRTPREVAAEIAGRVGWVVSSVDEEEPT